MKYALVIANNPEEFTRLVQEKLDEGYEFLGELMYNRTDEVYAREMICKDDSSRQTGRNTILC